MTRPHRHHGYVLLLTLLVLALAATALAAVSRASVSRAAQSVRREEELQRRWATLSTRHTLLPQAERLLGQAERSTRRPQQQWTLRLDLAGHTYELVIADEQAKLNVNALLRERGAARAQRDVRDALRAAGSPLTPRFVGVSAAQPSLAARLDSPEAQSPLDSFGQVFPGVAPEALPSSLITCWGDGSLNFRRASAVALTQYCAPQIDTLAMQRFLELRDGSPDAPLEVLLNRLQLPQSASEDLEERLTDASACHSIWISARTPQRSWYYFTVSDRSISEPQRIVSFTW